MSPLLDSKHRATKDSVRMVGGVYTLIDPNNDEMPFGRITVRVLLELLPSNEVVEVSEQKVPHRTEKKKGNEIAHT